MDAGTQPDLWWEDFKVGEIVEMGRYTFTEPDIVAFARQYDQIGRASCRERV